MEQGEDELCYYFYVHEARPSHFAQDCPRFKTAS